MPIVVIGLNHHTSPVTVREKFAFSDAVIPGALQTLKERGVVDEAVIISTCNRVEVYALGTGPRVRESCRDFFFHWCGSSKEAIEEVVYFIAQALRN